MPTIKKTKLKPWINKFSEELRKQRQEIYSSDRWHKMRLAKLIDQPLCEICLSKGKITPAVDVHHKDSFMNYEGANRLWKAYDYNNLMSLCKQCHAELHKVGHTIT